MLKTALMKFKGKRIRNRFYSRIITVVDFSMHHVPLQYHWNPLKPKEISQDKKKIRMLALKRVQGLNFKVENFIKKLRPIIYSYFFNHENRQILRLTDLRVQARNLYLAKNQTLNLLVNHKKNQGSFRFSVLNMPPGKYSNVRILGWKSFREHWMLLFQQWKFMGCLTWKKVKR